MTGAGLRRAFLAVPLPEAVRTAIDRFARTLPRDGVTWVRPENLHITLRFLGALAEEEAEAIEREVRDAVLSLASFSAAAARFGAFPRRRDPRVLWVGVDAEPEDAFTELAAAVDRALARCGRPPENRRFTPHITIGRIRDRGRGRRSRSTSFAWVKDVAAPQAEFQDAESRFGVDTVVLYESEVEAGGRRYVPRMTFNVSR